MHKNINLTEEQYCFSRPAFGLASFSSFHICGVGVRGGGGGALSHVWGYMNSA